MARLFLIIFLFFIPLNYSEASLSVPILIEPANNSQNINLYPDSNLFLKWMESDQAAQYQYQYWKKEDSAPEDFYTTQTNQSLPIQTLEPNATYFWRVRSCNESDCSPYSPEWNFTFLLAPPKLISPINGGTVTLPAELYWESVPGAKSYSIKARVKFINQWIDPENPLGDFYEQLGLPINNITCPFGLWNEPEDGWTDPSQDYCSTIPIKKDQSGNLQTNYTDKDCSFAKDTEYTWQVASCLGENETNCGNYGSKALFKTTRDYPLPAPILKSPVYEIPPIGPQEPSYEEEIPIVEFNDSLGWEPGNNCSHYQKITIKKEGERSDKEVYEISSLALSNPAIRNYLWKGLNNVYSWKAESCYATNNGLVNCEAESESWKFQTKLDKPINLEQSFIRGNAKLFWEAPKALSWEYQVKDTEDIQNSDPIIKTIFREVILEYPYIQPNNQYWWRVRSCADEQGLYCGDWSETQSFVTLFLNPPSNLGPESGKLPAILKWDSALGANFYQYKVFYSAMTSGETLEECYLPPGQSKQIIPESGNPPITSKTEFKLSNLCLGEYTWRVRSCFDKDCLVNTDPDWTQSPAQAFTAIADAPLYAGLVPCGRTAYNDNPSTPYNERESCQIKHFGFLLQNIFDFILWKLGLLVLGLYSIMSSVIAYFSLGRPNTLARIKSIWKSAGVGYLIMFLAWTIINLIMAIVGYQVQLFGRWFELPI